VKTKKTWKRFPTAGLILALLLGLVAGMVSPLPTQADNITRILDLGITKADSHDPAAPGDTLVYTLDVFNFGPHGTVNVVVTDTLPIEVSYVSDDWGCSHDAGIVTCDLGDMDDGTSATIQITVEIDPLFTGIMTNVAEVTSDGTDVDPSNNIAVEDTTVVAPSAEVDLSITKADSHDPAAPGDTLIYTLDVANDGPDGATDVTVIDTLPDEVSYVSDDGGCNHEAGIVTCDLGDMAVGDSASIQITVEIDPQFTGILTNIAEVGANEEDIDPSDNVAIEDTTVARPPSVDLRIAKADSHDPAAPGDTLIYTLDVANRGRDDASGVVVVDTLPDEVSYVSDDGGCSHEAGIVTCDLGDMAVGDSASIEITVDISPQFTGILTNIAEVGANEEDIHPSDNVAIEDTTVEAAPPTEVDLSITKADSDDPVKGGDTLVYTLDIANAGPGDATGVTAIDTLPAEVVYVGDDAGCSHDGGVVTCDLGDMAAGDSASIEITVNIPPLVVGTLTNVAEVEANEDDVDPSNNVAEELTTVLAFFYYIPKVIRLDLGFSTIQVVNFGDEVERIATHYFQLDGTEDPVSPVVTDIPVGRSVTYMPVDPAPGFDGSSVVVHTGDVAAISNIFVQEASSPTPFQAGFQGFTEGGPEVIFPLIMKDNNFNDSTFNVQNTTGLPVDILIEFVPEPGLGYDPNIPDVTDTLPPWSAHAYDQRTMPEFDGVGQWVGSALVTVQGEGAVAGVGLQIDSVRHTGTAYTAFLEGATEVSLPLIMDNNNGMWTGINCQNLGPGETDVTVTYRPEAGYPAKASDTKVGVAENGTAVFLQSPFGDQWVGSAVVTAGNPMACVVNQANLNMHYASAYQGFDPNQVTDLVVAPLVQYQDQGDGMPLWTGINIKNLGDNATTVTMDFLPADGFADVPDQTVDIEAGAVGVILFFDPHGDGSDAIGGAQIFCNAGTPLAVVINQAKLGYVGDIYSTYNAFAR
jgi:uncharacterized repeat protein (TIGR01451 family)